MLASMISLRLFGIVVNWLWRNKYRIFYPAPNPYMADISLDKKNYLPTVLQLLANIPFILRFYKNGSHYTDHNVMFYSYNVLIRPALNSNEIVITVTKPGKYEFTCQNNTYRGKLIVHSQTD